MVEAILVITGVLLIGYTGMLYSNFLFLRGTDDRAERFAKAMLIILPLIACIMMFIGLI